MFGSIAPHHIIVPILFNRICYGYSVVTAVSGGKACPLVWSKLSTIATWTSRQDIRRVWSKRLTVNAESRFLKLLMERETSNAANMRTQVYQQNKGDIIDVMEFLSLADVPTSSNSDSTRSGRKLSSTAVSQATAAQQSLITKSDVVDWDDRIGLQSLFAGQKHLVGWEVEVEWRETKHGIGLFATEPIAPNTILRRGIINRNLYRFCSVRDVESFCQGERYHSKHLCDKVDVQFTSQQMLRYEPESGQEAIDTSKSVPLSLNVSVGADFRKRIRYVKDYLWGLYLATDDKGYPTGSVNEDDNCERFFGMWIPGNGLNHDPHPNTVYRWYETAFDANSDTFSASENSTAAGDSSLNTVSGVNLLSLTEIAAGQELFDDYRRHGPAPLWLLEFAKKYKVTLNFANCNDFVSLDISEPTSKQQVD
jgi:hypothetical protein